MDAAPTPVLGHKVKKNNLTLRVELFENAFYTFFL
jgi:hypothetical protein